MLGYESLHTHTTLSDGLQSHLEVLASAEKFGYGVIAFTDHDVLPDDSILSQLRAYQGPVKWLLGCEISSGLPKEIDGGSMGSLHILGLGVDPKNRELLEHCTRSMSARIERMEKIVRNLQNLGFKITVNDCLEEADDGSVGRPHIVRALGRYPENAFIVEELRKKMEIAAESDPALRAKYDAMMLRGPEQYPYALFLSDDSFIKNVLVGYSYTVDMDESVALIRNAGGVAVIAHWGTVKDKISEGFLKKLLEEKRLDGVEIASLYNTRGAHERRLDVDLLRTMAVETGAIMTIGTDAHNEDELEQFSETEIIKESVGMTEKIKERLTLSPEFSRF